MIGKFLPLIMASGWLGTAFTSTIPEKCPRTVDDWWAWARDFTHQASNVRPRPTNPNP